MNKKRLVGTLLASSIALTAAFSGCSLVSSNSKKDMKQVIATVNIANAQGLSSADKELINNYKSAVGTTEILKDSLIAYYLNYGATYINYGYSYSAVFNMFVDSLVENAVITQYAIMYMLDYKAQSSGKDAVLAEYSDGKTYIEKLEYLLTDETAEDPYKDVNIAKYNFYSTLNSTLDTYEQEYLEEEEATSGSGSHAVPTGVDTEKEDFYPAKKDESGKLVLDYNVYTGYKGYELMSSGDYKEDALEGTTPSTRARAYNRFVNLLMDNGLVDRNDPALLKIEELEYMQKEYATRLENQVINKYYEIYEEEQEAKLTNGDYSYLKTVYNKLLDMQKDAKDSFSSTFSNISDTSFVLYSPDTDGEGTYGFVYNILLPFNAIQNVQLTSLQSDSNNKDDAGNYNYNYYNKRNDLLKQIKTTDQREAWFNGTTDYSFKPEVGTKYFAGANNDRSYLFFENNFTNNDRYEKLDKYIGEYAYNGRVYELEDGGYQLLPNILTIDDMLAEFTAYIDYVLGEGSATYEVNENYYEPLTAETLYTSDTQGKEKDKDKEINFNNFIYASGKVDLGINWETASIEEVAIFNANLLNKDSIQYQAIAAVNELQYAYTTDTGVLSQYLGYDVTLGDTTGYIKEFETAAHEAIKSGAGSFNVCAGDYGWHLIYVTYTLPVDEVVYNPEWDKIEEEGTFEYMFYEWLKSNELPQISTIRRTQIMTQFNVDATVNKIESAYQNLLDLDKQ